MYFSMMPPFAAYQSTALRFKLQITMNAMTTPDGNAMDSAAR
jgi:hypothetical protein